MKFFIAIMMVQFMIFANGGGRVDTIPDSSRVRELLENFKFLELNKLDVSFKTGEFKEIGKTDAYIVKTLKRNLILDKKTLDRYLDIKYKIDIIKEELTEQYGDFTLEDVSEYVHKESIAPFELDEF